MAGFDTRNALNLAIRHLSKVALERNAGGWIPPKERERQQKDQERQQIAQQRDMERQQKEEERQLKAIGGGTFSGTKMPSADKLAKLSDKFIYHSGTIDQLDNMKWGLEPQHGDWIKEVASGATEEPEEALNRSVPLVWMSDDPSWVSMKVGRKIGKHPQSVTEDDIRQHGHLAMIPRKGDHAEHIWKVGNEGLDNGPHSTVTNLNGKKAKAYETDLYESDMMGQKEPFGVERNEYISAQPVEPMFHLTGQDLVDFLKHTNQLPSKSEGGQILSKQFPTQYMPNVGRQVMQDGGTPLSLSNIINRNQDIQPSTPNPTPEELSAARADTRVGRDIVAKRLNVIVPESERVVGGAYRPGAPGGMRWSDLPPEVLNTPGRGFNVTDDELQNLWQQSLGESSAAAQNAAREHSVNPIFGAKDWDKAMRLPYRDHLWYELSGEKMAENMPDLTHPEFLKMMDIVGATSARAKPGENLERSLAALSQHLRGVPVDVDLTIPETVRQALGRTHEGSSALPGNKTGYFSDTLALTGGVPTRMPISVNDVWVGKMFGIPDSVMSSNQSLHEPMAKYFNKIRDLYNERHGGETPFTYQSWNFQAPAWVHLRGEEAGEESGDAYHQVWGNIINKLKEKNIPGIDGDKITREALMHPGFADALRRTTGAFRAAPKATVEFGTTQTDVGREAHQSYQRAIAANDDLSQNEYLSSLTKAMYASARGEGHPWERLKKAITGVMGQTSDITRIAHPTSENPLDIGGTFESAVSPNIRVPLKDMSDDQVAYFNAVVGKHLKQDAMAASHVLDVNGPESEPRDGHIRGYSAFVPTTESMPHEDIRSFATELNKLGHDMSYARYPNGYRFDVIPNFNGDVPKGIDHEQLADAYDAALAPKYGDPNILAHDFKSIYTPSSEYEGLRSKLTQEIKSDFLKEAKASGIPISAARKILSDPSLSGSLKGRSRKAWDTYSKRIDHLSAAEQGFQDLAQRVNDAHSTFITKAKKRSAKYPEGVARGGVVGYKEGGSVYEPHQRAEEQGYTIKGYHFTRGPRAENIARSRRFDPTRSFNPDEEAVFFWTHPEAANEWMDVHGPYEDEDRLNRYAPTIMPVRINPGRHLEVNWPDINEGMAHYHSDTMGNLIKDAQERGFDSIRIKNMKEADMSQPHDQIAILNPRLIRSEFAQFDPRKKYEDNIGASRGGMVEGYADGGSPSISDKILQYAETLPTAEENIETLKQLGRNVGEGAVNLGKRIFSGFEKMADQGLKRSLPPTVRAGEREVYVEPKREEPRYVAPDQSGDRWTRKQIEDYYAKKQANFYGDKKPAPTRAPMRERMERQANVDRPVVLPKRKGFDWPQVYKDIMSDEPQMEWTKGMTPREQEPVPVQKSEGSIFSSGSGRGTSESGPLEVSVTKTMVEPKDVYLGTGDTPNPFHLSQTMAAPAPEYEGQIVPIPDTPKERMYEHHLGRLIWPLTELKYQEGYKAKQGLEEYNPPMSEAGERFPTQQDVDFYRSADAYYGRPEAGYIQEGARGSFYDDLSRMTDRQGGYRRNLTPQESDAFMAAYMAAQRNPIAALGFRPEEFDFSGSPYPQTTAGMVSPTSSRIYTDLKFPSVAVHEAVHRGLTELANADRNAMLQKQDALINEMTALAQQPNSDTKRFLQIGDELRDLRENYKDADIFEPGNLSTPEKKDEQEMFVRALMYKMFGPIDEYENTRQGFKSDVAEGYPSEDLKKFMADNADRIGRLEQRALQMLQQRQRAGGPRASGGAVRSGYAIGGNPADLAGGGYGTGNIGGGSSISSGGSMAEARAADRASVSGYSADTGGGGYSSRTGGDGGSSRDSSSSRSTSSSNDGGSSRTGGDGGFGGIGIPSGPAAFGRPAGGASAGLGFDPNSGSQAGQMSPITGGFKNMALGSNIGAEMLSDTLKGGNSPLASGIDSYNRDALDAANDRIRTGQQVLRDAAVQRTIASPPPAEMNIPNAGDLYGATNAPLAVNQKPSGMFGQPEFGTTSFGQSPMQSGFSSQASGPMDPSQVGYGEQMAKNARNAYLEANFPESPRLGDLAQPTPAAPFAVRDRAGSMGSMPMGMAKYGSDLTQMSSQPNRPISQTPFSGFPRDVQNAMIPERPDSAFGQTLIDPSGKYTQQALNQMKVATDAVTMLNSPTLAGAFVRAFTPTPTPATPQQQAAIERMYRRDLNSGVPANFATPEGMAERYPTPMPSRPITPTPISAYGSASQDTANAGLGSFAGALGSQGPSRSQSVAGQVASPSQTGMSVRQNFKKAFAEARSRGDQEFVWTNPVTGQSARYRTILARKEGGRIPLMDTPNEWLADKNESKKDAVKKRNKPASKAERNPIVNRALMVSSSKS